MYFCIPLARTPSIKIYRTIILPIVLYGCETWSLILRVERKLKAFVNSALDKNVDLEGTR